MRPRTCGIASYERLLEVSGIAQKRPSLARGLAFLTATRRGRIVPLQTNTPGAIAQEASHEAYRRPRHPAEARIRPRGEEGADASHHRPRGQAGRRHGRLQPG